MAELTTNVNWIAVIVGFVLAFLLGWLWYSPKLFGTKWAEGVGVKLGDAQSMPMGAMAAQAIGTFLLAWLVGATAARNELMTIILAALTIAVLLYGGGMFAAKLAYARNVEAGFVIAMVVVTIIVQAIL